MSNEFSKQSSETLKLDMAERQKIISAHPFFANVPAKNIAKLAQCAQELTVVAGKAIVIEGEPVDKIYLIVQGSVDITRKVTADNQTKDEFIISLQANAAIGLVASGYFSTEGLRTATATAVTDVLLLSITVLDLHNFMHGFHYDFLRNLDD